MKFQTRQSPGVKVSFLILKNSPGKGFDTASISAAVLEEFGKIRIVWTNHRGDSGNGV